MTSTAPLRIVLADDHALFRQGLKTMLRRRSEVTIVGDVASLADLDRVLADSACDVVLLDLQMERNALSDIERLARLVRVVVVTASEHPSNALASLQAGASAIVFKRFAIETLVEAIRASGTATFGCRRACKPRCEHAPSPKRRNVSPDVSAKSFDSWRSGSRISRSPSASRSAKPRSRRTSTRSFEARGPRSRRRHPLRDPRRPDRSGRGPLLARSIIAQRRARSPRQCRVDEHSRRAADLPCSTGRPMPEQEFSNRHRPFGGCASNEGRLAPWLLSACTALRNGSPKPIVRRSMDMSVSFVAQISSLVDLVARRSAVVPRSSSPAGSHQPRSRPTSRNPTPQGSSRETGRASWTRAEPSFMVAEPADASDEQRPRTTTNSRAWRRRNRWH